MPLDKIQKRNVKIFKDDEITLNTTSKPKPNGTFGEIIFGTINNSQKPIALKRYKEDYGSKIFNIDVFREIIILQFLNQYPETQTVEFYGIYFTNNGRYCYLVLESLEKTINRIPINSNQELCKIIFYKLLKSINAIHSLGFLHNDIKMDNIMINHEDIKIIDFGLAKFIGLNPINNQVNNQKDNAKGSGVINPYDNRISFSSDSFSIGATMVHIIHGDYIVIKNNDNKIKTFVGKDMSHTLKHSLGDDGFDLLLKLTDPNNINRWCVKQALNHDYFKDVAHIKSGILNPDEVMLNIQVVHDDKAGIPQFDDDSDDDVDYYYDEDAQTGGILFKQKNLKLKQKKCDKQSLNYCYFKNFINKPIIHGGIYGLDNYIDDYTKQIYDEQNLELCYFQEMFNNYKDMICPIKRITTDINEYSQIIDFIIKIL